MSSAASSEIDYSFALRQKAKGRKSMYVAIDDSGTSMGSFQCIVSLASSDAKWAALSEEWIELLDAEKMERLHTADYLVCADLPANTSTETAKDEGIRRKGVVAKFSGLIGKYIEAVEIVAVDAVAYKAAVKDIKKRLSPQRFIFLRLLVSIVNNMARDGIIEPVSFIVDDSADEVPYIYSVWKKVRRENALLRNLTRSITFADDNGNPPVQAADLVACLVMRDHRADRGFMTGPEVQHARPMLDAGGFNIAIEDWHAAAIADSLNHVRDAVSLYSA